MPESDPADPEITAILRHLQGTEHEQAAWLALQRYRAEALASARAGVDHNGKEELVRQARARLRAALLQFLGGQTVGPAVDYVIRRTQLLRQHADDVLEVRGRHTQVRTEMIVREVRIMVLDGLSPRLAETAARNNLAVRLRELDEELVAELGRLQGELRRKLARLLEDLEDGIH
jgi:hypothetical protein